MTNVKLQDQLGDAFASLAEIAGPKGKIHVVVEVVEEERFEQLKPHVRTLALVEDIRLTVRRAERVESLPRGCAERLARSEVRKVSRGASVVRWTLGGG